MALERFLKLLGSALGSKSDADTRPARTEGAFDPNYFIRAAEDSASQRLKGFQPARKIAVETISPHLAEGKRVLHRISDEVLAKAQSYSFKLTDSERYQQTKGDSDDLLIAVILAGFCLPDDRPKPAKYNYVFLQLPGKIAGTLLRKNLPFDALQLAALLDAWLAQNWLTNGAIPPRTMLAALKRHAEKSGLSPELRERLQLLEKRAGTRHPHSHTLTKEDVEIADTARQLLDPGSKDSPSLPPGQFGTRLTRWLETLPDAERAAWAALAVHAGDSGNKGKPTQKWESEARTLIERVGIEPFAAQLPRWLSDTTPDPHRMDSSLDILKGMIWAIPLSGRDDLAGPLGRFAERCFQKVRGVGSRSTKLGNACLLALGQMGQGDAARAELFRLQAGLKLPSVRKTVDDTIARIARAANTDIESLADAALPDFGLDRAGVLERDFGGSKARLSLSATHVATQWTNDAGKPVKAPPAAVKSGYKEDLAALKQLAQDIDKARSGQIRRLEAGWLEDRHWRLGDWQCHYLGHPLRLQFARALVWRVESAAGATSVMPDAEGNLIGLDGETRSFAGDDRVRLWHPLHETPAEVIAWRKRIIDAGLTQPIKQAHREVYVLTDAERATRIYSNRFAAHILRQHQFYALCKAKDWRFDYLGGWDNWNQPNRNLPHHGLTVEYAVEDIDDGQRSAMGVPLHLSTDQVRFLNGGEAVPLDQVDPIVFSEVMRDVDLFVAVTSVANDPEWRDGGPDGHHQRYWRQWAFGDLGQSAETRKELIEQIVPRLSIADKLRIGDKALLVTGKRHEYAIHFGSTNIQIMPENRYLCIVPDRGAPEAEKVRLPFTGDSQLSTILAKAFMLVDESRIKDPTILRQL